MEGDEVVGTRAQLHQVLDDVDLIARQLISCINNSNHAENRDKMAENRKVMDVDQLARLLSTKQGEIQELVRVAGQQKQLKDDVTCIKQSIVTYDKRISNMQRTFNEAERLQVLDCFLFCLSLGQCCNQTSNQFERALQVIKVVGFCLLLEEIKFWMLYNFII